MFIFRRLFFHDRKMFELLLLCRQSIEMGNNIYEMDENKTMKTKMF
jgi:hypothetical protein